MTTMFRSLLLAAGAGTFVPALAPAQPASAPAPAFHDSLQGSTFTYDGNQLVYQVSGTGPAMLLIHGFPLSGILFHSRLAAFRSTYTVIVPDLPGFGRSTTATTQQTDTSYTQAMFALLDHLGSHQAIIGGHSMGGQIVLNMSAQQPSRFNGMILFDTNPAAAAIVETYDWPGYAAPAGKMGTASIAQGVAPVMATGASIARDPILGSTLAGLVSEGSPDGVAGGANALVTRPDYTSLLPTIAVPTLVMVGENDSVYPAPTSRSTQQAIPGATLSVIAQANHASMYQRPADANRAIRAWLAASTTP